MQPLIRENESSRRMMQDHATKPKVIGIYGIPGCGKTTLMNKLKDEMNQDDMIFYDGSTAIDIAFPGDLEAFKLLDTDKKTYWRKVALGNIATICREEGKTAMVAGHYLFWENEATGPEIAWTEEDARTYTHIIYLDVPVSQTFEQRRGDYSKHREHCQIEHLARWQQKEKRELRLACLRAGILFTVLVPRPDQCLVGHATKLVRSFLSYSSENNLTRARKQLDHGFEGRLHHLQTMLVIDGDRTLVNEDTGKLFWEISNLDPFQDGKDPLKAVFSSAAQYNEGMFRQAMLLYGDFGDDADFNAICDKVAENTTLRPDFRRLLEAASQQAHVGIVLLTAGLHRVFVKVLERESFAQSVVVVGSDPAPCGCVITDQTKAALVQYIRHELCVRTYAFGDSKVDLGMLKAADEAVVVISSSETRSRSMESELRLQLEQKWPESSNLRQLLVPANVKPLDIANLPVIHLESDLLDRALALPARGNVSPKIIDASEKQAASLLMTPMRDARVQGPMLRSAHINAAKYLAVEYLSAVLGTESYAVPHVQGGSTEGFRLRGEQTTLIVALMRGGEPMALGVNEALPEARFLHAKDPTDIKDTHLRKISTVILVDSVINTGASVVKFADRLRAYSTTLRIVFVAGVTQRDCLRTGRLASLLQDDAAIDLVTLRISANKYTGSGVTDTGNRLFNTTDLL